MVGVAGYAGGRETWLPEASEKLRPWVSSLAWWTPPDADIAPGMLADIDIAKAYRDPPAGFISACSGDPTMLLHVWYVLALPVDRCDLVDSGELEQHLSLGGDSSGVRGAAKLLSGAAYPVSREKPAVS